MDLKNVVNAGGNATSESSGSSSSTPLKSDGLFLKIQEEVKKNSAKAKTVDGVFLYNITVNGKTVKQWSKLIYVYVVYQYWNWKLLPVVFILYPRTVLSTPDALLLPMRWWSLPWVCPYLASDVKYELFASIFCSNLCRYLYRL